MLFCPTCSNILWIHGSPGSNSGNSNRWFCQTCPYQFPAKSQVTVRTKLKRKQIDDVMGGEESWKNVDSTEAACVKCGNDRAYFMQLQIRSADEPMTTFYRCTNTACSYQWKEN